LKETSEVRVRFAPSPTGHLHVGGARTALFNWLFARHHGGVFVLRVEDTDQLRSDEESFRAILDGLRWLGLDWDEGPDVGGGHGPYVQSERRALYRQALEKLLADGKAYACTCSPEKLAKRRKDVEDAGGGYQYEGTCRHRVGQPLPEDPHVIRLLLPQTERVTWEDGVRGEVSFATDLLDDFVLVKSDGFPTYNFAAVVDDAAMGMTHILRGDDHISNTPRQLLLYDALGEAPPHFAHIPMILGPDGSRLSKRHGATSVQGYRDEGILSEAMVNFLALLGWSYDGKQEFFSREELVEKFTMERITKSAAVFNLEKLEWMNGQYFRQLPGPRKLTIALEELHRHGVDTSQRPPEFWEHLVSALGERFSKPSDAWTGSEFLFAEHVEPDAEGWKRLEKWSDAASHLPILAERLEGIPRFDLETTEKALRDLASEMGAKAGALIHPSRIALTGRAASFGIFDIMVLLGKEETVRRLRALARRLGERKGSDPPDK
jgi:glutamyl-tRNA synthetase